MAESNVHNKYKPHDIVYMTNTWKKSIIKKKRLTNIKLSKQLSIFPPHFYILQVVCTVTSIKKNAYTGKMCKSDRLAAWTLLSLIPYIIVFEPEIKILECTMTAFNWWLPSHLNANI